MKIICLDLEGVLVPEIWIAFSEAAGIPELRRTTRDEPDYDKLMVSRLAILKENRLGLADIQKVIAGIDPLPGAKAFTASLREAAQLIILSDTFEQFAAPLMAKLNYPTLFCNTLLVDPSGAVTGYQLRRQNGKCHAVKAFRSMGLQVFAAGDSFNDLAMIEAANAGALFRAPPSIRQSHGHIPSTETYAELRARIDEFLGKSFL
ncbi:MAG: bifunctional phosphoserine phosphatase/homoserine phosphotransferase ThrH [Spirochaetaceae bacterium]|jgi:phosphoserine/homoserine phosphotransferase|nr:bifunctional phosphoserine phosphatase/homoserine phosphotransferase ThrH [Spirochaetaceae bacterium]